ncbi:MAG: GntR family transcriptional regulator [Devosia sp.]|jgi:DNA-binding GntR family transcriptional regulator|uniref:GntR family transcriptional regulator n=1 Tax=Devosia sp. XGJD_8 TaxID=3391187 RepID=UPI001D925117|nr:GntR family transcriptional regulator [Alphaproteobacteria bacterium]MBU1561470.1 GntR family transcriptional regulator [Alphaproteobacteria bacterium]MBU2301182.1 GntR family transcriptional regulator [Alphaproteobacteria bacterium]MBU2368990.1 GntR family transcriptional regulator [Alphaproteobacteria bacterium]
MTTAASPYSFLARPTTLTRGSVTADVTHAIRTAIVTLALPPGSTIDKSLICAELGVSRFPVSEALARLQIEGLVDIAPQRGSTVSLVRIADVREYMLIRKGLESEALRVLIGSHDPSLIDALHANMAAQREAAERDDAETFHQIDVEFHDIIYRSMRLTKVKTIIDSARANLDRARRLIITPRRLALTIAEHQAIFDGILAADAAQATRAIRAHIDAVMVELFAFAREHPGLFADGESLGTDSDSFPFG